MIKAEPAIKVGVLDHRGEVRGNCKGGFLVSGDLVHAGAFHAQASNGAIVLKNQLGEEICRAREIHFQNVSHSNFTLHEVLIGIDFHWERMEEQAFPGDLRLILREGGTIAAINEVSVEDYLASVISSEMSAGGPLELLKAQAITSRSWLVAMLERESSKQQREQTSQRTIQREGELIRWYDREDHDLFDVCADDHCQRYQGVTKIISPAAAEAVRATRGVFLIFENEICDARYSKACGGLSENFENTWEETPVPYLRCISDAEHRHPPLRSAVEAEHWILSQPNAFCNTSDGEILRQILPSFDQETTDFYRWTATYAQEELQEILRHKSGMEFGTVLDLVPVQRGPSGRIIRLKIVGTKQTLLVGKELEIRRWLSNSHLYSSAFVVRIERDANDVPTRFILRGAGWGHGVGLCQIGAAVMAMNGYEAEDILQHYFCGTQLKKLY
ncbi:MAG: SpoIID/LytB domain-containing protein [bacterium]